MAVARKILVAAFHMLATSAPFHELEQLLLLAKRRHLASDLAVELGDVGLNRNPAWPDCEQHPQRPPTKGLDQSAIARTADMRSYLGQRSRVAHIPTAAAATASSLRFMMVRTAPLPP
jgi:hypothetical protein